MVDEHPQDDASSANEDHGSANEDRDAAGSEPTADTGNATDSDGLPSEGDLDDLLAQACTLAETISEETGHGEEEPEAPLGQASEATDGPTQDGDDITDAEPESDLGCVDAHLADLDKLVAETEGLLGDGDDSPSEDNAPSEDDPPREDEPAVATNAPPSTIMADLLDDPATPDAIGASLTPSEGAADGVESPAVLPMPAIAVDPASGIVSTRTQGDGVDRATDETGEASGEPPLRRVLRSMEPVAIRVCDLGVDVLERLDKPFGRVGTPVRRAIGWLAIATFATSILTLVVSLF